MRLFNDDTLIFVPKVLQHSFNLRPVPPSSLWLQWQFTPANSFHRPKRKKLAPVHSLHLNISPHTCFIYPSLRNSEGLIIYSQLKQTVQLSAMSFILFFSSLLNFFPKCSPTTPHQYHFLGHHPPPIINILSLTVNGLCSQ